MNETEHEEGPGEVFKMSGHINHTCSVLCLCSQQHHEHKGISCDRAGLTTLKNTPFTTLLAA